MGQEQPRPSNSCPGPSSIDRMLHDVYLTRNSKAACSFGISAKMLHASSDVRIRMFDKHEDRAVNDCLRSVTPEQLVEECEHEHV